jgi:hypothetical protein
VRRAVRTSRDELQNVRRQCIYPIKHSTQPSHPPNQLPPNTCANEDHTPSHPQNTHKMMFKFPHCLMEPNIHSRPLEHIITFGLPKSRSSTPQPIRGCRSRDRQEGDRGPDFGWVETCVEGGVKRRGVFSAVWCGAVWFWESDV